ncbi:hypothetical protein RIF29_29807 [Crotalaria pallida]|uniref:Ribonuclease H n=1 Tax=Crotalaria pallida TaxID=3830 RepID=A0AAN9EKD9_CROPI
MEDGDKGKGCNGNKQPWKKGYPRRRKSRFYNVYVGRRTGIYTSWHECHMQVTGFSGASFESFDTFEEAKVMWDNHVGSEGLGGAEPIRDNGPNGEGSSSGLGSEGESMAGEARVGDANESENVGCLEAFILGLLVGLAITHKQFYP